jgi:peptide methionine sulfoxide reductase msrA/msrB
MKLRRRVAVLPSVLFPLLLAVVLKGSDGAQSYRPTLRAERPPGEMLIDSFSSDSSGKRLAAQWEFVSDRVMGGVSTGRIEFGEHDGRSCLHITGSVSLGNNGGFIQAGAALARHADGGLGSRGRSFDAHRFKGIRLSVMGNGQSYAVHLRTRDTRSPGQFYQASFPTDRSWQQIEIPFTLFRPNSLSAPLNTKVLESIAVAAAGREFDADIFVDEIAFYRDTNMHNPPGDALRQKLTAEEERVIIHKGTEAPFSGKYYNYFEDGTYTCKRCGAKLFDSSSKFPYACGWPSFDDQIKGTVKKRLDADGVRTEIVCSNCGAHLGHLFAGEHLTPKNTRYCVNSISMNFVPAASGTRDERRETRDASSIIHPASSVVPAGQTERAIFASGCFWGAEYYFQRAPGVLSTTVGYTGGHVDNPTYKQVCTDKTGHAEAVEVIYDPSKTSYEQLARLFFETHDFTQLDRQGPDVGKQYRSAVFYLDEKQKEIAAGLVQTLNNKGFDVKTEIAPAGKFWPAEQYRQDYYKNNGKTPYCHVYRKIF